MNKKELLVIKEVNRIKNKVLDANDIMTLMYLGWKVMQMGSGLTFAQVAHCIFSETNQKIDWDKVCDRLEYTS